MPIRTKHSTSAFPRRLRRAFTLVEIVIVIALIAVISGVLITGLTESFGSARADLEKQKIDTTLPGLLLRYNIHVGSFPTTEEGLQALVTAPAGKEDKWKGPYATPEQILDGWNKPYRYARPGTHNPRTYDLWSWGPNEKDENGDGDDIANWKKDATTVVAP